MRCSICAAPGRAWPGARWRAGRGRGAGPGAAAAGGARAARGRPAVCARRGRGRLAGGTGRPRSRRSRGSTAGAAAAHSPSGHGHATPETAPTPSPAPEPTPAPATTAPPDLEGAGDILPRTYAPAAAKAMSRWPRAASAIRPNTATPSSPPRPKARWPFAVELDSAEPQVLILHTHATECYQPWEELVFDPAFSARTEDKSQNMCAVGARMAQVLNAAGVNTLHDTTLHDSPSYTESYARSAQTARTYCEKYPSIKVILDVHRDAIEADGARIKPVCTLDGEPAAQVMIIAGCTLR